MGALFRPEHMRVERIKVRADRPDTLSSAHPVDSFLACILLVARDACCPLPFSHRITRERCIAYT